MIYVTFCLFTQIVVNNFNNSNLLNLHLTQIGKGFRDGGQSGSCKPLHVTFIFGDNPTLFYCKNLDI